METLLFISPIKLGYRGAARCGLEPERGFEPANLPITNRLRCHCATRARGYGPFASLIN